MCKIFLIIIFMSIAFSNTDDNFISNPSTLTLPSLWANDPKKNIIFNTINTSNDISFIAEQLVEKCAICLSKKKNPIEINNCHHIFCSKCIRKWYKINKSCPLCKSNIISLNQISH